MDYSKLLINSAGCELEYIAPFDDRYPETREFYNPKEPLNCEFKVPDLTTMQGGVIKVSNDLGSLLFWKKSL